jgi:N-acetylmuramoyl-L-alanine amidase
MQHSRSIFAGLLILTVTLLGGGCASVPQPGQPAPRTGDEIVAAGKFFHTGTPVVLWMDPGGYDAYRVQRRFGPYDQSSWAISHTNNPYLTTPNRYGLRSATLMPKELEQVRGGGWSLPQLQKVVDQFVIHFDVAGTSRRCFEELQDQRDLSVHFLLDVDGTIYQTLDLKERAWDATIANNRSIGIEIANIGAYPVGSKNPFAKWYKTNADGRTTLILPPGETNYLRTPGFVGHPARPHPIYGNIQGENLVQYDYTPQQYQALIKLTAALCKIFPRIKCQYPTDKSGHLITHKLSKQQFKNFHGILGHFHIQTDKVDPGPAFQWDYVITNAQKILNEEKFKPVLSPRTKELSE